MRKKCGRFPYFPTPSIRSTETSYLASPTLQQKTGKTSPGCPPPIQSPNGAFDSSHGARARGMQAPASPPHLCFGAPLGAIERCLRRPDGASRIEEREIGSPQFHGSARTAGGSSTRAPWLLTVGPLALYEGDLFRRQQPCGYSVSECRGKFARPRARLATASLRHAPRPHACGPYRARHASPLHNCGRT
jgi:hypothetical protein